MAAAKHELRRSMRRRRKQFAAEAGERAEVAAADQFVTALEAQLAVASVVALYAAVRSEIGTTPLATALLDRGLTLAYPRVVDGQKRLEFHRVDDLGELVPTSFDIPEPAASAPVIPVQRIDLFVVPGLAFDAAGNRLGWGQGHYDFTLADNREAVRVGFAFEGQIVEAVPSNATDLPMDFVVTETGFRRRNHDQ